MEHQTDVTQVPDEMSSKQLAMLRWTQKCVYLDMHDGLQARVSIVNDHPV